MTTTLSMGCLDLYAKVEQEYRRARSKHAAMRSLHEGLAVLWEEFEEVKAEVFLKKPDHQHLREELIQVMAMCRAFYYELVGPGNQPHTHCPDEPIDSILNHRGGY